MEESITKHLQAIKSARLVTDFCLEAGIDRKTVQRILGGLRPKRGRHPLIIAAIERALKCKRFAAVKPKDQE